MEIMTARLDSVCKFICEQGDWKVSNLRLQKILYMAQMYHMGLNDGARLVDSEFQAWDYGPVCPSLYRRAKAFGSSPLRDIFFEARGFRDGDPRKKLLVDVCKDLLKKPPGALVEITHWEEGAWAKNYVPKVLGVPIPDEDIVQEYHDRVKRLGRTSQRSATG
jgi:uncharacterized phage-associated protein